MTFCLGLARDHWALVAADTRTRWREYALDEPEPWDTPVLRVVDGGLKLLPLPTGWLVGGPSVQWRDRAHDAMRHATRLPELLAAHHAFAGPAMVALEAECPGEASGVRERQSTILVVRSAEGFAGAHVDWAGRERWPGLDGRVSALCPELPLATMLARVTAYQAAVQHERDLRRVVRATAALFAEVYAECGPEGSVSGEVAIGLIDDQGRRLIGPCPHTELLGEEVPC
jgi:hypothetical protein